MDLVEMRWEALQCHLRACSAADPMVVATLNRAGRRLTAVADGLAARSCVPCQDRFLPVGDDINAGRLV